MSPITLPGWAGFARVACLPQAGIEGKGGVDAKGEELITSVIAKIVEEDKLKIAAYNICVDHMHLLLVCKEKEVPHSTGTMAYNEKMCTDIVYNFRSE